MTDQGLRSTPPGSLIPAPECPGPDCPECSGEACRKCGAGITRWPTSEGNPPCEHDSAERHEEPDAGHIAGIPVYVRQGDPPWLLTFRYR